jgi:hypothetical protein
MGRLPDSFRDLMGQGMSLCVLIVQEEELSEGASISNQHDRQKDYVRIQTR